MKEVMKIINYSPMVKNSFVGSCNESKMKNNLFSDLQVSEASSLIGKNTLQRETKVQFLPCGRLINLSRKEKQ